MSDFGILGYGAYVPRKRMSRTALFEAVGWAQPAVKGAAKGARAFAAWDEDAITMAVEAGRAALDGAEVSPDRICLASTTAPFLDRQNAGVVATALDLPANTHAFETSGSQRAASSALIALSQQASGTALLATSECRPTASASLMEMYSGDAAAALLIGTGTPIAEIKATNSVYADIVDHYRTEGTHTDYTLEERWFRDAGLAKLAPQAVTPLLEEAELTAADIDHLIAPLPNPGLSRAVAGALGVDKSAIANPLFDNCGHAGAAHPLLVLTHVLERAEPGAWILITAFGQGCDAILLRATDAIAGAPARGRVQAQLNDARVEENYVKFLAAKNAIDIDWGMRAERDNRTAQTVAFDKSRDIYGFVGGICRECETPQFPKARRCVNPECAALDTQYDYAFSGRNGAVKSYTEDWMAFTREPPLIYGNVSFEGGGNVFMEMCGFVPGEIAIGTPVEMRFRIKDIDTARGFHRYFWKAAPISGGGNG